MKEKLALLGGPPVVTAKKPHFSWPPPVPGLPEEISRYIAGGRPLSITDRSGIYGELEDKLCNLHGRRYAILVSSGTMALYSAFFGLGLEPGDEVVSTVYSFHATASPLLHLGVKVVFCDTEADTGNVDSKQLEELISPRTRAVVTNHMWGHPVDCGAVAGICERHGISWVEDCSHAHFSRFRGRHVGSFGDASVLSLQGNKLLTGGEGGVLLTDSQEIYERATLLGHGLKRSVENVKNPELADIRRTGFGLKLRMHPLAAVTVSFLLDNCCFDWISSRHEVLDRFARGLEETQRVMPMARREYVTSMGAHYGFKPRLDFDSLGVDRDRVVAALKAEGLKVSVPGSKPFHQIPLFDPDRFSISGFDKADWSGRSFPGAEAYYDSIISLPTFTFPEQVPLVDEYIAAFHKVLGQIEALR